MDFTTPNPLIIMRELRSFERAAEAIKAVAETYLYKDGEINLVAPSRRNRKAA